MESRSICRQMFISALFLVTFLQRCRADLKQMFHQIPDENLFLSFEWNEPGDNITKTHYLSMDDENDEWSPSTGAFRRPGWATETHSCGRIRAVPYALRSATNIGPRGLHRFYQKYTEAYNIPVLGSSVVPDAALKRACYVVRFLLAGHSGVRQSYYKLSGRVAIMAQSEVTTSIPEHAWLGPSWNQRARGLGATTYAPVSTGAEENVLCYSTDRYRNEDIFLHEFSHGIHLLGAKLAIPGWDRRLRYLYGRARQSGLWRNTYSMSTPEEYFAEAVQSYFEVNAYSPRPDGIHGPINTRAKLQTYDPELYALVKQVFPCQNMYIKRCSKDRDGELYQRLRMNCNEGGKRKTTTTQAPTTTTTIQTTTTPLATIATTIKSSTLQTESTPTVSKSTTSPPQTTTLGNNRTTETVTPTSPTVTTEPTTTAFITTTAPSSTKKITLPPTDCLDHNPFCARWARGRQCRKNPAYMLRYCKKSCNNCDGGGTGRHCRNYSRNCRYWSLNGECERNPRYMLVYCKRSCNAC